MYIISIAFIAFIVSIAAFVSIASIEFSTRTNTMLNSSYVNFCKAIIVFKEILTLPINLITKEAFDHDGPTMRKARALVHSFVASSQLNDLFKNLQTGLPPRKKAVTVIQNMLTLMVVDLFYGRTTSQIKNIYCNNSRRP